MSVQRRRARQAGVGGGPSTTTGPLAIIGTTLAVVVLGYYVYKISTGGRGGGNGARGGSQSGGGGAGASSTSNNAASTSASSSHNKGSTTSPRPSLSLSLPPNFARDDPASLSALRSLLTHLSPHFVVHLIAPPRRRRFVLSGVASSEKGSAEPSPLEISASLASLTASLVGIPLYDERRTLEYSKESGRQALSRALACDAHCEVLIPAIGHGPDQSTTTVSQEEADEAAAHYASDLSRLRKGTGLLILLALPSPSTSTPTPGSTSSAAAGGGGGVGIDVERALEPFRTRPGHPPPPGVRLFDLAQQTQQEGREGKAAAAEAWQEAGRLVSEVRKSWR